MKLNSIIYLLLICMASCLHDAGLKENHLLPEKFKGVVVIIHGQANGEEIKKEDGVITYQIPVNGILVTKNPLTDGLKSTKYYYLSGTKRTDIPYCWNMHKKQLSDTTVYVFGGSTGTYGQGKMEIRCTTYIVGTVHDADSLSQVLDTIHPVQLMENVGH